MTPNEFGAKFQKSSIRNDDICNELALSRESIRYDQREKDREKQKRDQADLMAEADAVLAETNAYFNARKQALVEKHLEGRESLQTFDHVFSETAVRNPPKNYLDAHEEGLNNDRDVDQESDRESREQEARAREAKRSQLFTWNAQTDKDFGLDELPQRRPTARDAHAEQDYVSLNIGREPSQKSAGVVRAVDNGRNNDDESEDENQQSRDHRHSSSSGRG